MITVLLAGTTLQAGDPVLITHPDNNIDSINARELEKIYRNKKTRWPDGTRIRLVTRQSGPLHKKFLELYLGNNERQFSIFWKRVLYTGKGVPPISFTGDEEVIAYVAANPGAIGYVGNTADLVGVKKIEVKEDAL
ncbi:MAG: substrate-binding domain-containing protein [Acidobacteriota bacterium]|nr:substrate-binding domain-containing protein [Acidobacteriota bacterium]